MADLTDQMGLTNYLNCSGYTYIDDDLDDLDVYLDIILQPFFSPTLIYENELSTNKTIVISLRDYISNRMGIGSRIIISYGDDNENHQVREM